MKTVSFSGVAITVGFGSRWLWLGCVACVLLGCNRGYGPSNTNGLAGLDNPGVMGGVGGSGVAESSRDVSPASEVRCDDDQDSDERDDRAEDEDEAEDIADREDDSDREEDSDADGDREQEERETVAEPSPKPIAPMKDSAEPAYVPENCTRMRFEQHSYWLCTTALNWFDAREQCREGGGDLAAIESVNEQASISARIDAGAWLIGLNRSNISGQGAENAWGWASGGDLSQYRNWGLGEPGIEFECGALVGKVWVDYSCLVRAKSICEFQ